jgi:hypothetical protein
MERFAAMIDSLSLGQRPVALWVEMYVEELWVLPL